MLSVSLVTYENKTSVYISYCINMYIYIYIYNLYIALSRRPVLVYKSLLLDNMYSAVHIYDSCHLLYHRKPSSHHGSHKCPVSSAHVMLCLRTICCHGNQDVLGCHGNQDVLVH